MEIDRGTHTDHTSTPEHNQQLSERHANTVKAYLLAAGIDAVRLSPIGYTTTRPWPQMIEISAAPKTAECEGSDCF